MKTREVARAVILVAIAVSLSPVFIPVGIAKCYPAQHMVNCLSAVLLGPIYAVIIATITAIIRNLLGAFLAGLAYRKFKNIYMAGLGEVIGTGAFGSLVSVWIVAPVFMGKTMAMATLMIAFSMSTLGGSIIGIIILHLLRRAGIWKQ